MADRLFDDDDVQAVQTTCRYSASDSTSNVTSVEIQDQPQVSKLDNKKSENEQDQEDKEVLISEILELQNTLHDLSQRVHSVKEENEQLQVENQVSDN